MLITAVAAYAAAIVAANLSVAAFGPAISPLNAFLFIGFDLALRDWLHIRLKAWQMLALIAAAGGLSYGLNPAAGIIAIASTTAFIAAAVVDWGVFTAVKGSWLKRSNMSNVAAAAVDSLVFPTIAFGALMPHIVAMQFIAKVLGGALWTWILNRGR
jgi:uncharacterized PurR-regulated membrane protein YhhQ (DUF165 family)